MASILGWFAIPSSNGSCFVRTFHYGPIPLGWSYMALLTASLSYTGLLAMTRQLSVEGIKHIEHQYYKIISERMVVLRCEQYKVKMKEKISKNEC